VFASPLFRRVVRRSRFFSYGFRVPFFFLPGAFTVISSLPLFTVFPSGDTATHSFAAFSSGCNPFVFWYLVIVSIG